MPDMYLGNIDADTSDEEINEFLGKYGFPPFDSIQRVQGTGARPAAVLTYDSLSKEALRLLQTRVHNLFWKNRTINALTFPEREE